MGELKFIKKPDWVSWDAIQECQRLSHQRNIDKGLKMHCAELTGEGLKEALKDGTCFIALDDDKVVGLSSLIVIEDKFMWYKKKRLGYLCYEGILPEYQGTDVWFGLQEVRDEEIKRENVEIIYFDTAESNTIVRKMSARTGSKECYWNCFKSTDYYSVVMGRWLKGTPPPDFLRKAYCRLSEIYIKTRFKPHRIKRFRI